MDTQSIKSAAKKIAKNSIYGLRGSSLESFCAVFPKTIVCNDVYICRVWQDTSYCIYALCKLNLDVISAVMGWYPIHCSDSKEEAKLWCDIRNYTVRKAAVLEEEHKEEVDEFNKQNSKHSEMFQAYVSAETAHMYPLTFSKTIKLTQ